MEHKCGEIVIVNSAGFAVVFGIWDGGVNTIGLVVVFGVM